MDGTLGRTCALIQFAIISIVDIKEQMETDATINSSIKRIGDNRRFSDDKKYFLVSFILLGLIFLLKLILLRQ